jgi:hypothetical protein
LASVITQPTKLHGWIPLTPCGMSKIDASECKSSKNAKFNP